jgi:menaquinol-cytochrome c reductase iron-sulfur subunit
MGLVSRLLGLAIACVLAVPGVAYLLTPVLRRKQNAGSFVPVARLSDLEPGVPRVFPVIQSRKDAWVTYPPEPVGSVWLVRQPEGDGRPVLAFTSECPHLACPITLAHDAQGFFCPCHVSSFQLDGKRTQGASLRDMDSLEIEPFPAGDPDPLIRVRFQRFQSNTEARIPLA